MAEFRSEDEDWVIKKFKFVKFNETPETFEGTSVRDATHKPQSTDDDGVLLTKCREVVPYNKILPYAAFCSKIKDLFNRVHLRGRRTKHDGLYSNETRSGTIRKRAN